MPKSLAKWTLLGVLGVSLAFAQAQVQEQKTPSVAASAILSALVGAALSVNSVYLSGGVLQYTATGAAPAVSCGTGATIDAHASNKSGTMTCGTGTVTSATITFATPAYQTWNHCRATSQSSEAAFAYSYTLTAITITGTNIGTDKVDYDCDGA